MSLEYETGLLPHQVTREPLLQRLIDAEAQLEALASQNNALELRIEFLEAQINTIRLYLDVPHTEPLTDWGPTDLSPTGAKQAASAPKGLTKALCP